MDLTSAPAATFPATRNGQWLALAAFIVVCLAAGWLGTVATTPAIPTWYAGLEKPWFNPPNGAFPVVWTILYAVMAVAAWLVWRTGARLTGPALVPFSVQLGLNATWSFAFFGAQSPALGLAVIALLWLAIVWTIVAFSRISGLAALLLGPYLAWVTFATALNASILALN